MPSPVRYSDPHPWRTARQQSWTVRTFGGRLFGVAIGIAAWGVSKWFGWARPMELIFGGAGGVLLAPPLEMVWGRIRGPFRAVAEENWRLARQIDELQKENWLLRHPDPLDLHVAPIHAYLDDDCKSQYGLEPIGVGHLLTINVSLTNRSAQDMSLDYKASLLLVERSLLDRSSVELLELMVELMVEDRKGQFHFGVLDVPAHKTVSVNMGFLLSKYRVLEVRGIRNIAGDGHTLTLLDRVSNRNRKVTFGLLSWPPALPDTEKPFSN